MNLKQYLIRLGLYEHQAIRISKISDVNEIKKETKKALEQLPSIYLKMLWLDNHLKKSGHDTK